MARIKKTKEKDKPETSTVTKVSKKTILKPKKIEKTKKLVKKVQADKQIIENVKSTKKKLVGPFNKEQFEKGIDALMQYIEKNESKDLFTREKAIFLQIDTIKIPLCPNRRIRLPLKHSLLTDKQEVCLIVPDLKKGRRIDHDATIEHYEELLRSKNVQSIKRIIPIRQLRVEYDQFELKRKLCGYYDYFLVAGNISGHVSHLFGKIFMEKRKAPIPIKLESTNLAEIIEDALKKTTINIHSKGMTYILQFGHSEMTQDQLVDNLTSICQKLQENFPGGFTNIRSLHIKTDKSISIPVYYTLKTSNSVPVPVIKPTRPKNYEKVTGELTTKLGKSEVTVHPGGRIEYEKKQTGQTRSQLRKISQGRIQKRSAMLKARREKQKLKKLKKEAKKNKIKNVSQTIKTEKKKQKKGKENGTTVVVKQEKSEKTKKKSIKKKKEKIKSEGNLSNDMKKTKKLMKKEKKTNK